MKALAWLILGALMLWASYAWVIEWLNGKV